jgi:hypothetical protein
MFYSAMSKLIKFCWKSEEDNRVDTFLSKTFNIELKAYRSNNYCTVECFGKNKQIDIHK